jgi:hypothetical protein
MSLLIALILLEGGSYTLRTFVLSATPDKASENYQKNPNWSEETAAFGLESEESEGFRPSGYASFIGWRSSKRTGRMLNIDDEGNRITSNNSDFPISVFDFYGGSTTWGWGVSDANTIPSRFARIAKKIFARNFGQQAYNSRQELNYLLNNVVRGQIGDVVIFYDGINDVVSECWSENGPFGDTRTGIIRTILSQIRQDGQIRNLAANLGIRNKIALLLPNTTAVVERLTGRQLGRDVYLKMSQNSGDACRDPEIADLVAENMVRNWETASLIAKHHKATFYAILQPFPTAESDRPTYHQPHEEQLRAVYPLIKAKTQGFSWFIDGTSWLNGRTAHFSGSER